MANGTHCNSATLADNTNWVFNLQMDPHLDLQVKSPCTQVTTPFCQLPVVVIIKTLQHQVVNVH